MHGFLLFSLALTFYLSFCLFVSVFWGYHKQGSCQAGMSAAISKVNILFKILFFFHLRDWNSSYSCNLSPGLSLTLFDFQFIQQRYTLISIENL